MPEVGMSHLSHTCWHEGFKKTETLEASFTFIMSADKLLYDNLYWKEAIEEDICKLPLDKKLHLVFTLVMFLQISVAQLLNFIFTSKIKEVQGRAARFLGHTPTATLKDMEFQPNLCQIKMRERWAGRFDLMP